MQYVLGLMHGLDGGLPRVARDIPYQASLPQIYHTHSRQHSAAAPTVSQRLSVAGFVEMRFRRIARNYVAHWFMADLSMIVLDVAHLKLEP